jgi:hypothetical protein
MVVFSAQFAEEGGPCLPPTQSTPPAPLELHRSLHLLPSKTTEIKLPVLKQIAPLPFSLFSVMSLLLSKLSVFMHQLIDVEVTFKIISVYASAD